MNQPQNPVPPRGARPQLFKEPSVKPAVSRAKHHADFGPSILATIDGKQARFATPRDHISAKRVMLMGVLALVIAAAYVGVKFNASRQAAVPEAAPTPALPVAAAPATPVVASAAEAAASAPSTTVAQGGAAIETVAQPVVSASAQAAGSAPNVATSLNNIQLALNISEPASAKKDSKVAGKEPLSYRGAAPASPGPAKPVTKAAPAPDTVADADLLAAMLPHLKRNAPAPTSPDYEKRCGKMTGDAAVDCRAKFCNGRQGADAACPVAAPAQR